MKTQTFRTEVRQWLERNKPDELPPGETDEGFPIHRAWERRVFEAGYSAISWPTEYGGRGGSLREWLVFEEEYFRAGLPQRVTINGITLLGPPLMDFGTAAQKKRYLTRIASAEDIWCQGWSEPDAGSDLASLSARAVRDENRGGWLLTGQKCWSTRGAFATHMFGLFRTGPREDRHRGLTYFLIDLNRPGVTVRPVAKLDGCDGFADVFFDDAFVADDDVLGEVGAGWDVAMATAGAERSLMLRAPGRFDAAVTRLVDAYREADHSRSDIAQIRHDVVDAWLAARSYHVATDAVVDRLEQGGTIGPEASASKVFWSEMDILIQRTGLRIAGQQALLGSRWIDDYMFSLAGPIYAGTNEIQRSIVAERVLGLPRS